MVPSQAFIHYYGAIRATRSCLACHPTGAEERDALGELQEGSLMAVVKIRLPTGALERR